MVGNHLRENSDYRRMLEPEGRRCWRITYADSARFHMDILPAIPDREFPLLARSVPAHITQEAILITDKKKWHDPNWPRSNPRGYAIWFEDRMRIQFDKQRRSLMEAKGLASVEEVPPQTVRTPLQRAIQLLKRHRNQMFGDDKDQPISMIITTLAARAYRNQEDIYDALAGVVAGMRDGIEVREGVYWVSNPVNSAENYADKWGECPQRATKFFQWLDKVEADLRLALQTRGLHLIAEQLRPSFGEGAVERAVKQLGEATYAQRKEGQLFMETGTGTLGLTGVKVKDHTFHGQ